MEVKILDKLWIMLNNFPKEITITKIITDQTVDDSGIVVTRVTAYAKYSETLNDHIVVDLEQAAISKSELMNSVFNL